MDYLDESTGFDIEKLLEESSEKEQHRLEEELGRIEEQLEQRDEVHEEIVEAELVQGPIEVCISKGGVGTVNETS